MDKNKRFPLQNAEHRPEECFSEFCADVLGNHFDMLLDPDFSMAAGFHLQGKGGSNDGMDMMAGMYGAIAYGVLPESNDVSDPIQTSEARETDWGSYTPEQIADAAALAPFITGITPLYSYDQVTEYTQRYQTGAGLELKFYKSWFGVDGQLPTPKEGESYSYHFVAAYETYAQGIKIKAFDAPFYHYLPRSLWGTAVVAAAGFSFDSSRWLSLAYAIVKYGKWDLLPELKHESMKHI
jgi:hypothetical protein